MQAFNPRNRMSPSGQTTMALFRISQAIQHLLRSRSLERGLSATQSQALLFLRHARPGVRNIGGLAQRLASSYATASQVADALERKHLLVRLVNPQDQRSVMLQLTPAGEDEGAALENLLDGLEQVIDNLPAADRGALRRASEAMVRYLQREGHVTVYEMCTGCQFFRRDAHPDNPRGPHHCAFVDAPLAEAQTQYECPDFLPVEP